MRKITFLLFVFLLISCFIPNSVAFAQQNPSSLTKTTPNSPLITELILSVDPKNNEVNGVFLKEKDSEAQLYKLKGECYRCEFYDGSIEGSFKMNDFGIRPEKKAIITIYTARSFMPGKMFDPGPFPPGSRYNLARTKTTVIENQKGKFKLKTI